MPTAHPIALKAPAAISRMVITVVGSVLFDENDTLPSRHRQHTASKRTFGKMSFQPFEIGTALPPGDYVLDVQRRARGHVRAKPQRFTIVSNHTVRVDMDIDTGVR